QRDALARTVDRQHDSVEFLALLVATDGHFARLVPVEIRQVDETVDAAIEADEDAEVGDRLDRTVDAVALLVVLRELFPRIRLALLHAEGDTATLAVDVEDHDLDFVADLNNLRRVDVLVRPVHFRNVDEAFNARLDFDERTVVGDVGDLAEQ